MPDRDHDPGPHASDDAPALGNRPLDLSLSKPAGPPTWARAKRVAFHEGCGGALDLTRDDTPERMGPRGVMQIVCPCEKCGAAVYLSERDMVRIAKTVGRRRAPAIVANIAARGARLDELSHALMDEEVMVERTLPGGEETVITPASPEEIAKVATAALAHDKTVLGVAGVGTEKVEVEVNHTASPTDRLLDEIKAEIVREIREKAERTIDAEVVKPAPTDAPGA